MTKVFVEELFPEIQEICDADLRAKTATALCLSMEKGGWTEETVHLAPVTIGWENVQCNLINHVRKVTQVCMDCYARLAGYYDQNGTKLNRDLVVSGALLHDIGKFVEFTLKDGKPVHSDRFYLMRHPLGGAIMAAEAGLPDTIVHLIATHSFEGERSNQTPESSFVRSIDIFVFNSSVYGLRKK